MNKVALIGAVFAVAIVIVSEAVIYGTEGIRNRIFGESGVLVFNMAWAAAPFIVFSFVKKRTRKRAIGIGVCLTACLWFWVTWDAWSYLVGAQSGGSYTSPGMIILVWPIFVFTMMMVLTIRRKWDRPHDGHFEDGIH